MSETTEHPMLSEFLLERIAEDKEDALLPSQGWVDMSEGLPLGCWDSDRVLAECEAKRRIVEMFERALEAEACSPALWAYREERTALQRALEVLAQVHAEHADYREEWRPDDPWENMTQIEQDRFHGTETDE